MDKKEIESRDKRLLQKLNECKRKLPERKESYEGNKVQRKKKLFGRVVLAFVLFMFLMTIAVSLVFKNIPLLHPERRTTKKTASTKKTLPDKKSLSSHQVEQEVLTVPDSVPEGDSEPDDDRAESFHDQEDIPEEKSPPIQEAKPLSEDKSTVTITEIKACKDVVKRACVGEQYQFSLKKDNTPFIWMRVSAASVPQKIKNIYYFNNKQYAVVMLDIPYPQMRTWSKVTLNRSKWVGSWRVDILQKDGTLLKQVAFEVNP